MSAESGKHEDRILKTENSRQSDWWDDLLPARPHSEPPGAEEMLRLIIYDIADPKRLRRIAQICEDYGVRVQKSVFECWLDEDRFEELWSRLQEAMKGREDSLAAYVLDSASADKRRTAGKPMVVTEKRTMYLF